MIFVYRSKIRTGSVRKPACFNTPMWCLLFSVFCNKMEVLQQMQLLQQAKVLQEQGPPRHTCLAMCLLLAGNNL